MRKNHTLRLLVLLPVLLTAAAFHMSPFVSVRHHHEQSTIKSHRSALFSSALPARRPLRTFRANHALCMIGVAGPDGGDLAGGADEERNAQLASLKKMVRTHHPK